MNKTKIKKISSCLFLLVLLLSVNVYAEGTPVIDEVQVLLSHKRLPSIESAIDKLESILADEPDNGTALWVMAKAKLYLGDRVEKDKRLEIYESGKEFAEQATEIATNSADAYYWLAALTGRVGQTKGILNSLFMIGPLKEALDSAIELDADFADPYFAMSQLYQQAPGWPLSLGNKDLALEYAEKAVELDPGDPEFQVQLARVLVDHKRHDEALELLEIALESPEMEIDLILKAEAEELYAKIK